MRRTSDAAALDSALEDSELRIRATNENHFSMQFLRFHLETFGVNSVTWKSYSLVREESLSKQIESLKEANWEENSGTGTLPLSLGCVVGSFEIWFLDLTFSGNTERIKKSNQASNSMPLD